MLIEAAKGGHTNVVSYLLDYPNNILSVPAPDMSQLTPPSHDASQVSVPPLRASLSCTGAPLYSISCVPFYTHTRGDQKAHGDLFLDWCVYLRIMSPKQMLGVI